MVHMFEEFILKSSQFHLLNSKSFKEPYMQVAHTSIQHFHFCNLHVVKNIDMGHS
jgi:hypothetical protein